MSSLKHQRFLTKPTSSSRISHSIEQRWRSWKEIRRATTSKISVTPKAEPTTIEITRREIGALIQPQENKEALNAKIERGLAQLDLGEGISGDKLRERLEADKTAWLADHSGS